jgi:hypothetical protein
VGVRVGIRVGSGMLDVRGLEGRFRIAWADEAQDHEIVQRTIRGGLKGRISRGDLGEVGGGK